MPQRPSASPAISVGTSPPSALTTPSPVITTRAGTLGMGGGRPVPFLDDEVDERVHRGEGAAADVLVRDRDVEAVLDQHDQLERVDRVEPERIPEDRPVVGDVGGRDLQPETG